MASYIDVNNIKKIDDLKLFEFGFYLICSKRNSGKSVLVKNLVLSLTDKFDYDFIISFSDTIGFYPNEWKFISKNYESDQIDTVTEKIFEYQKQTKNKQHGLIILDDVKLGKQYKMLNKLICTGRHYKIGVILSTQWIKGLVSSSIRNNIDFLFFSDLNSQALKIIHEIVYTDLDFRSFFK